MAGLNRPLSQMRKLESKESLFRSRKRILKYLVLAFLKQEGCFQSAEMFYREAGLTGEYEVCDNIDLDIILQDYSSYYLTRFNKIPQFCKKIEESRPLSKQGPRRTPCHPRTIDDRQQEPPEKDLPPTFVVKPLSLNEGTEDDFKFKIPNTERKPLAAFLANTSSDTKQLAEVLYQDIVKPLPVSWDEIKGLEHAKSLLMESVVYPMKCPEVFTGLLEPWRGILLHGPPGTGKTMLAKAIASESNSTFFNVSCSTMVNKWRGDSEKIVKILFQMACYYEPSIIFVDEVESLVSERSAAGEHEASRRFKSQLLTELDGVSTKQGAVFLLANSNMPWEIDPAMLRRLEKRIYIPLPDFQTRIQLFKMYLNTQSFEMSSNVNFEELSAKTEGYSGSDIKLVCKEAVMATMRKILPNLSRRNTQAIRKDKLEIAHLLTAISKTKPISNKMSEKHVQWQNEMGSC